MASCAPAALQGAAEIHKQKAIDAFEVEAGGFVKALSVMNIDNANIIPISLRSQVEDKLRKAIVKGHFAPGMHLSDRILCEAYNVSRTVIREAIRQLEAEGLVKTIPHRGSFVKILTLEDARHIYSLREALESLAVRQFVRNAPEETVDELAVQLEKLRTALKNNTNVLENKEAFYGILLAGAGNPYLRMMLGQILNWTTQLRAISLYVPERLTNSIVELDRLFEAIRNRREDEAYEASVEHVRNAADVALAIMAERERENAGRSLYEPVGG